MFGEAHIDSTPSPTSRNPLVRAPHEELHDFRNVVRDPRIRGILRYADIDIDRSKLLEPLQRFAEAVPVHAQPWWENLAETIRPSSFYHEAKAKAVDLRGRREGG